MRNWWNANKVYSLVNNTAPILTSSLGSLYYGYTRLYFKGRRVNAILQLTVICNVQITKIISNLKVKKSDIQQMQSAQYSCFPIWTFNYKETFFKTTCVCVCVCVCVCMHSLKSCWTLCNTMDCSPSDSSVHGISQARILEWVASSYSRISSWQIGKFKDEFNLRYT